MPLITGDFTDEGCRLGKAFLGYLPQTTERNVFVENSQCSVDPILSRN